MQTRRTFLQTALVGLAAAAPVRLHASPLGLPLGIQLYSVREQLAKDYRGTLKQLAALGYKQVEAAGFFDKSPSEVKVAMAQAGLACVSAHYSSAQLYPKVDEIIDYAHALGLEYIVCSFPAIKNPARLTDHSYEGVSRSFLTEDWYFNAEHFNLIGAKIRQAGMRFAYHNHTVEFRSTDGAIPYEILMLQTDPSTVSFELDCGWVVVGGGSPEQILHRYGKRIHMLHLKDFQAIPASGTTNDAVATEMGRGALNNTRILAAARAAAIKHVFVEQEAFNVPWVDSLRMDAAWLRNQR